MVTLWPAVTSSGFMNTAGIRRHWGWMSPHQCCRAAVTSGPSKHRRHTAASPFSCSLQWGEAILWIKGVTKHSAPPTRLCVWLWLSKLGPPPTDSSGSPASPPAHGVTCSGAGAAVGSEQCKALGSAALSSELLCSLELPESGAGRKSSTSSSATS